MPDFSTLSVFLLASFTLLIVPGPAVMYILARSVDQGRIAGFVSILGITVGTLFHIAAAVFGLSALIVSSAIAFSVVKYAGAAYLIYLGIRRLFTPEKPEEHIQVRQQSLKRIFYEGIVVNLLNPKTALFFFAFLPQFVDPARAAVTNQIMVLGGLFIILAVFSDGLYAMLAGSFGSWLKGNTKFLNAQRYVVGTIYVALGVFAAVSGSSRKH